MIRRRNERIETDADGMGDGLSKDARIYLEVPRIRRRSAMTLGCRFDEEEGLWYASAGNEEIARIVRKFPVSRQTTCVARRALRLALSTPDRDSLLGMLRALEG